MKPLGYSTFRSQRGSSIAMAIFVLVVVGMLGAAMVNILNKGQENVAREVISMRALMAAESGAERGLLQALSGGDCNGVGVVVAPSLTWGAMGGEGLQGCSAEVSCAVFLLNGVNYYTIKSEGECGPTSDRAHRIIQLQAHNP